MISSVLPDISTLFLPEVTGLMIHLPLPAKGDYVYGRGTTDDKGPVLEALYAMKLLRDSGIRLNKRVRLIMGCNEETGSRCMQHYNKVAEELSCGLHRMPISPAFTEKRTGDHDSSFKNTRIISMNGGFVFNAVCDFFCTTVIPAEDGLKEKLEAAFSESGLIQYHLHESMVSSDRRKGSICSCQYACSWCQCSRSYLCLPCKSRV